MVLSQLLYFIITFMSGLLTAVLAYYGFAKQEKGTYRIFSWFLSAISVWCIATAIQTVTPSLTAKVAITSVAYIGIATVPAFWLLFALLYTGFIHRLRRFHYALFIVPALTLGVVATNGFHKLFWQSSELNLTSPFPVHTAERGFWFHYIHTPYSYLLLCLSFIVLFQGFFTLQRRYLKQLSLLWIAALIPVFSNIFYVFGIVPSFVDFTPVSFALTGVLLTYSLVRYKLIEQWPVGYKNIFRHLQEAVLVLDENDKIQEFNSGAKQLLGVSAKDLLLRSAQDILVLPEEVWQDLESHGVTDARLGKQLVELQKAELNRRGQMKGYLLTIRNVTERKEAEAQLALQLEKLGAVVSTTDGLRELNEYSDVYDHTLEVVFDLTQASACHLLIYDDVLETLNVVASKTRGLAQYSLMGQVFPKDDSLIWDVISKQLTVRGEGDLSLRFEPKVESQSLLATPIRDQAGTIIAVLAASLELSGKDFHESDAAFIEAVAQACGTALIRLNLIERAKTKAEEYRDLYQDAERQTKELSLLDRIRTAVTKELDLEEVIKSTVEAIAENAHYPLVSLYLVEGSELVLQHQVGYPETLERLPANSGVLGRVVQTGQAVFLADPAANPLYQGTFKDISAEVAAPIFDAGKPVGVLNVETTKGLKLDQDDLRLLMALSEQVSIAIERARLYGEVQESEQRLRLLADNMNDLISLHDTKGRFMYITPSSESVLGYTSEELSTTLPNELLHPEDKSFILETVYPRLLNGETTRSFTYRIRQKSGDYIWIESFAQVILDDKGNVENFVVSSRDVTERKQMQEQMIEGALLYDALTNLPNRALFMDRLQHVVRRYQQESYPFAVLFLDLDRFKVINDSLGHNAGDQLLIEVSKCLMASVRGQDTVARLGGDEFAVLLEDMDEAGATELATRLQEQLTQPFDLDGYTVFSSASIGITLGEDVTDPEQLLRNADLAMYHAKANGKARHAVFDSTMHERMAELMELETELRQAIEEEQFIVAYQPMIDLETGEVSGFEALVRWQHPTKGLISPGVFIPVAEEMGLIATIDRFVLKEACRQLGVWQRKLKRKRKLSVSTNLSTKNFALGDMVLSIEETLRTTGLDASQLKLEITESVLMDNAELGAKLLSELRALGIRVQIDDFGTGYSSLSYLHQLPLDSLKIDRSFVRNLSNNDDAIIRTILNLARSLNLDVIAEGIETPEQLEQLQALGCDFGQGYYFAKPLPASEVEELFLEFDPVAVEEETPSPAPDKDSKQDVVSTSF